MPAVHEQELKKKLEEVWRSGGAGREALREELMLTTVLSTPLFYTRFRRYRLEPVLTKGAPGQWDEGGIYEWSIVRVGDKYYVYYDGWDAEGRHRVGLATSTDLVNWTKEPTNPILTPGPPSSWDSVHVDNVCVLRIAVDESVGKFKWLMWYSGSDGTKYHGITRYQIGLATSSDGIHWTKYEGNPVLEEPGGGCQDPSVIVHNGKFYMYYTTSEEAPEKPYQIKLAVSDDGIHWEKKGIVIPAGPPGSWKERATHDASAYKLGSLIVLMYSGWRYPYWNYKGTGFAVSTDGENFFDLPWNPVDVQVLPSAKGLADIAQLVLDHDSEVIYGFGGDAEKNLVLYVAPRKVGSKVPIILFEGDVAPGATTTLDDCNELELDGVKYLTVTFEGTYHAAATAGARLRFYTSVDGVNYDTEPVIERDVTFKAGATVRETFYPAPNAKFLKVTVENLDADQPIANVRITAVVS